MTIRRDLFEDILIEGNEDGTGAIEATTDPVPLGHVMEVERIVVSSDSAVATAIRFYVGSVDARNLRSGSDAGNFDEGEFDPPIRLSSGESLLARWTGASAGSVGNARLQARIIPTSESRLGSTERQRAPRPIRSIVGG